MKVSVVIPIYNEQDNIVPLYEELKQVMQELGVEWEVVFVDDGSTDASWERLATLARSEPTVKAVRLRRNFGQTAAMSAGFDHASGDVVVTMDGDRQNDPRDIPKLLAKLAEGYDLVAGWRRDRKDPWLTRVLPSRLANGLISLVTGVKLHDYGCTLKAFRAEVVRSLRLYGEMHRFIPALASAMGAGIAEVEVNHRPRVAGRSKYGLGRTVRVILDLIAVKFLLSYSTRPIQIFGLWGLVATAAGIALGLFYTLQKFIFGEPLWGKPGLILVVLLVLVGVQLISIGLLGELQVRTYYEAQGKPIYAVREVLGGSGGGR